MGAVLSARHSLVVLLLVAPSPLAAGVGAQQPPASGNPASLAELATVLADADPARAWSALPGLRALALVDAKDKKAAQKVVATWTEELSRSEDDSVRVLRAHALAALRELGLSATGALVTACAADPSASVRLASALALAELGEGAHKAMAKELEPADLVGGTLVCAAFARPGARSAIALKALRDAAKTTDSFRSMLLSEPALVALEILEQDVAKLLEERECEWNDLGVPVAKGLNWGGLLEPRPDSFFALFKESLALAEPSTLQGYAMPSGLRPLAHTQRLCDLYAAALGHVPRITAELLPALEDGSLASWDDYAKRTQPWRFTIELLMKVEERFVPADEK